MPAAAELGVGFVPYSPLGRGFLTGTLRSAADLSSPTDFRRTMPRFGQAALDANLAVVDAVTSVADELGATGAQVALAWLRHRGEKFGVTSVPIPGTRRSERVDENLGSLAVTLSPEQLTALDAAGALVTGDRFEDLSWVSAGRESRPRVPAVTGSQAWNTPAVSSIKLRNPETSVPKVAMPEARSPVCDMPDSDSP